MVSSEASCLDISSDPSGVDGPVPTDCWPVPVRRTCRRSRRTRRPRPRPTGHSVQPWPGVVGEVDVEAARRNSPCWKARMSGVANARCLRHGDLWGVGLPRGRGRGRAVTRASRCHQQARHQGCHAGKDAARTASRPVVRGLAADRDEPHYLLGAKMQDGCGQFGTFRSAREYPATGGRQGKRPLHRFFPVMRELLPVGRLAVRVSP